MKFFKPLLILTALISLNFLIKETNLFPPMPLETLQGKSINIPESTKGKYTLVGLAYSKKAEDDLKTWFNPVYQTFINKGSSTNMFKVNYDVHVYFVPMFTGIKQAAAGKAVKQIKKDIDPKLHPNILVFKGKLNDYKEELKLDDKEKPYFFVLNDDGKIVYTTSGAFNDDKLAEVEAKVQEGM